MLEVLQKYDWPGNVRELRNLIERMVVLSGEGSLDVNVLPEEIKDIFQQNESDDSLRGQTKSFEKEYIIKIMRLK